MAAEDSPKAKDKRQKALAELTNIVMSVVRHSDARSMLLEDGHRILDGRKTDDDISKADLETSVQDVISPTISDNLRRIRNEYAAEAISELFPSRFKRLRRWLGKTSMPWHEK